MRPVRIAVAGLILFIAACASGGAGGGAEGNGPRSDRNVLTAAQLANYGTLNAYEVVQRLRRPWLQSRGGTTAKVFVNGNERGGTNTLQDYAVDMIAEIRFVEPTQAMSQFGPAYGGGVIEVTLR